MSLRCFFSTTPVCLLCSSSDSLAFLRYSSGICPVFLRWLTPALMATGPPPDDTCLCSVVSLIRRNKDVRRLSFLPDPPDHWICWFVFKQVEEVLSSWISTACWTPDISVLSLLRSFSLPGCEVKSLFRLLLPHVSLSRDIYLSERRT